MKHLFKYIKRYWLSLILLVIFTYLQVAATLKLPTYMADIVDKGIIGQNMMAIYSSGTLMLVMTLGAAAASVVVSFLASRVATGFTRDIRLALFVKIERFSIHEFDNFSTASLITRSTNDMQQIQQALVMVLRMMLMAPIMAVGALQNALAMAPEMSWIITVAVVFMLLVIAILFTIVMPKFKLLQKMVDKLNLVTRENLTGLRVVRAFNNEGREQAKFEQANVDLTKLNLFTNRLMITLQPVMSLVMSLSTIAIVWFGAQLVFDATIQIGSLLAFMQYAIQVIMSFLMISVMFIVIPRAAVSARRVGEVLAAEPGITDPEKPTKLPAETTGKIEFRGVTFSYPGAKHPVLKDISFTAESNQTTAIIGSTGSGKTTLVNLIPRFYDTTAGQVLIDGVDVRQIKIDSLRNQIGFIPQKAALFSGTIASNIRYGRRNLSSEDMASIADIAQASQFIKNLDKAYDDEVSQGGANLSGGQKQRLSIARALAVDPSVYIFDDSFSALDFKTDAKLRKALAKKTKGKTVLIVAQRISSISGADKIIVLNDEGEIAGQGTHQELLASNGIYREIAASQLSDSELSAMKQQKEERNHG